MRQLCAWCGKVLEEKGSPEPQSVPETHGICTACSETVLRGGGTLVSFLDGMGLPILLLDANAALVTANVAARETLRLDLPKLKGELAGDVIECVYAALPGGCGQQLHCAACQIRNSVTSTFLTGAILEGVEAYQDVRGPGGAERLHLRISTAKLGDAVVLRLDSVERTPGP
jgi:hypothetical protein